MDEQQYALERVFKELGQGGKAKLANVLGISAQAVGQWKRCPPERVLAVEEATGGKITRHELRPDIYGPARPQPANPPGPEAA